MAKPHIRHLMALFEQAPNALVLVDADARVVDVNPAFANTFGYQPEEIIGQPVSLLGVEDVTAPEHLPGPAAHIRPDNCTKTFTRYRHKNGGHIIVRVALLAFADDGGQETSFGYGAIINDISHSGSSAGTLPIDGAALASEQQLLSTLYRRTPAMMQSIDAEGRILTVSEAWLARLGYTEAEVIGRKSVDFLTLESQAHARNVVLPAFWAEGKCTRVPYTMIARSGELVEVELSAVLDTSSDDKRSLAIIEDVTDRNKAQRALEAKNEQLRDFAHVAAHDLQAPLRHITMFSEHVAEDLEEGVTEHLRENIDNIRECASRLNAMVRALLDFSTSVDGPFDCNRTDLTALVRGAIDQHRAEIDSTDAMICISDLPEVACNAILIERVFTNIIGNALKYVAPGTTPQIQITGQICSDRVEIIIEDNGIGIAPEHRQQIFLPLKRLHSSDSHYEGSGIGLALCHKIIEAHNGDIRVEEATGGCGCRFVVVLPVREEAMNETVEPQAFKAAAGR